MSEDDDIRAAEYVLGTSSAEERDAFAATLARDASAQDAVRAWERRLAPLSDANPDVAPPEAVWARIESAVALTSPASLSVIEGGRTEAQSGPTGRIGADEMAALRTSIDRWRGLTFAASALAASLAIVVAGKVLTPAPAPATAPAYLAVVNRGGDEPALIVRVDLSSGTVFVRSVSAQTPSGKSLELWLINEGKAPKSMGVLPEASAQIQLPAGVSVEKAKFAVTVEPKGGSPSGDPTGPVVYSGQLFKE